MDTLNAIASFYVNNRVIGMFVVPAFFAAIVYFVYKKKDEFSYHALQNTSATMVLIGLNFIAINLFVFRINDYAQWAYATLHIPTLPADFWENTPLWLLCIFGVVFKDFVDYWNHRLMHTTWGWPTHAAHHSDTHVNAFTTYRVHFLEAMVMAFSYLLVLTWLQMPAAIPLVMLFSHVHNLYVHANLPFQHGPFKLLLASPVFHRWHHADVTAAYGKNLANMIPAWDAMFGTYYNPGLCDAKMGALRTGVEDKNPILIFVYPFRQWARLVRRKMNGPRKQRPTPYGHRPAQSTQ